MHPLAAPGALWVLSRAGKVPRPPAGGRNLPQETAFLRKAGKGAYLSFPVSQRISPLRRRPGGFPIAPWTPSGPIPICVGKTSHEKQTSCRRQEKGLPFFFPYYKGFRLCGGDQRAFRSPFGNLRPFAAMQNRNLQKGVFLLLAGNRPSFFPYSREKLPLKQSKPPTRPYALWEANHHYNFANSLNSSRFAP